MNVKEAVAAAKAFVTDTFAEEEPTNVGLEEVEFDDRAGVWRVTIGFSRPWHARASMIVPGSPIMRSYKVITINDSSGEAVSIKNRAVNDAA